jgi:ketosteroid isomerase-like protein
MLEGSMSSDLDLILAANRAFYRAFAGRDTAAMEALWAAAAPVACVHPGWPAVAGRAAVLTTWRQILANPASPRIRCHKEQGFLYGDVGFVICQELLDAGMLVATNIFVREKAAWRMVHHQASPLSPEALGAEEPPSSSRN